MSLLSVIRNDLDSARREKNQRLLTVLTTLYSEAAMVGKTKRNAESTDDEVISVVRKFKVGIEEIEKIKGSSENILFEKELYTKYLPTPLNTEELTIVIEQLVSETKEKNMGVLMNKLKSLYSGRYDGALASKLVKEKIL